MPLEFYPYAASPLVPYELCLLSFVLGPYFWTLPLSPCNFGSSPLPFGPCCFELHALYFCSCSLGLVHSTLPLVPCIIFSPSFAWFFFLALALWSVGPLGYMVLCPLTLVHCALSLTLVSGSLPIDTFVHGPLFSAPCSLSLVLCPFFSAPCSLPLGLSKLGLLTSALVPLPLDTCYLVTDHLLPASWPLPIVSLLLISYHTILGPSLMDIATWTL